VTDLEDPGAAKRALRERMKLRLRELSAAAREDGGRAVAAHLAARLDALTAGSVVALFASLPLEIGTTPIDDALRERDLRRALPRVVDDALVFHEVPPERACGALARGAFRVPTPDAAWPVVDLARCGLVLVPGVAFDLAGQRLGWGRGFYDRALRAAGLVGDERACGITLDEQLVDAVPVDERDVRLRALVTPARGRVSIRPPSAIGAK
jgi:5-formyltetrahydrofolate cyclo-ligase